MSAQALSFEDNALYSSDTSSDEDLGESTPVAIGQSASGQQAERTSWLKKLAPGSSRRGQLSIQSGDIVRSPTPSSSTPTSPVAASQAMSSPPAGVLVVETVTEAADAPQGSASASTEPAEGARHKGGCYSKLFPVLLQVVEVFFFSISPKHSKMNFPIISIFKLVANLVLMCIIVAICITRYPPRLNISIESFGVPSHPAQVHWDAFEAAQDGQFILPNTSLSPINNQLLRKRRHTGDPDAPNIQPRSNVVYPDCPSSSATQYAIHINWEMDLIFRVPEGNADDNILRRDRIAYIHEVEERIYNSTEYKHFCHKRSNSDLCDPLNSILTWLYPRDRNTGKYVYDTPDGFTPDLPATIRSLSANLSVALWFTGGEINFVNYSYVEAQLLRSQIRVGLPLPCFSGTQDRKEEQKEFVTAYFASLMSVFDELSTR